MLFYLDGEFVHAIRNPPADFDIEGHITMAIETYDWNARVTSGGRRILSSIQKASVVEDWESYETCRRYTEVSDLRRRAQQTSADLVSM